MKRSDATILARFVGRYFHATGAGVRGKLAEDFIRDVSEMPPMPMPPPPPVPKRHSYHVRMNCNHTRLVEQYSQPEAGTGITCTICNSSFRTIVAVEGIGCPPQPAVSLDELTALNDVATAAWQVVFGSAANAVSRLELLKQALTNLERSK